MWEFRVVCDGYGVGQHEPGGDFQRLLVHRQLGGGPLWTGLPLREHDCVGVALDGDVSANITVAGYYNVYTMYPAGANRAPSTPFTIQTDTDSLFTTVNQQASGGVWRLLASQVHLSPGHDVYVQISNLAGYSGFVVMADAVRFQLSQADVFEPLSPARRKARR